MKKLLFLLILCLSGFLAKAQKFGYIDTDFILNKMESYKKALQVVNEFSSKAQKEVEAKFKEVSDLRTKYESERLVLTEEMQKERLQEIEKVNQEAMDLNQKIFGYKGLLFLKKQELIQPVREELNEAVQKVARKHQLQMIFDKSGDLVIVYTDPKHDYTDFVLEELGLGDPEDNPKDN